MHAYSWRHSWAGRNASSCIYTHITRCTTLSCAHIQAAYRRSQSQTGTNRINSHLEPLLCLFGSRTGSMLNTLQHPSPRSAAQTARRLSTAASTGMAGRSAVGALHPPGYDAVKNSPVTIRTQNIRLSQRWHRRGMNSQRCLQGHCLHWAHVHAFSLGFQCTAGSLYHLYLRCVLWYSGITRADSNMAALTAHA